MNRLVLISQSPEETCLIGRQLGSVLQQGIFIALRGELGGGKTCFTRGVVTGAAPESAHLVASPTYAIMNEYPGRTTVHHFDFYRLTSGNEIIELGFEDYFQGDGICIAEWSERLGELLPQDYLGIIFEHAGDDRRRITIEANGPGPEGVLDRFGKLRETYP